MTLTALIESSLTTTSIQDILHQLPLIRFPLLICVHCRKWRLGTLRFLLIIYINIIKYYFNRAVFVGFVFRRHVYFLQVRGSTLEMGKSRIKWRIMARKGRELASVHGWVKGIGKGEARLVNPADVMETGWKGIEWPWLFIEFVL